MDEYAAPPDPDTLDLPPTAGVAVDELVEQEDAHDAPAAPSRDESLPAVEGDPS